MDRLTKRTVDSFGIHRAVIIEPVKQSCCTGCKNDCGDCSFKKSIDKLAGFEDADEQGLLVRLPCKVGGTVYTNSQFQGSYLREKDKPYAVKVVFIGLNGDISTDGGFINVMYSTGHMLQFNFSDIGKAVFLTRADAEKALAESDKE